jgi:hypothetical protein
VIRKGNNQYDKDIQIEEDKLGKLPSKEER